MRRQRRHQARAQGNALGERQEAIRALKGRLTERTSCETYAHLRGERRSGETPINPDPTSEADPSYGQRAHRTDPRWTTWVLGIIIIGLAISLQLWQLKWTAQHGLRIGTDSGKASLQICWSMLTLMADTAVVTAWTMWCMRKPRPWWSAVLAGVVVILMWILALPASTIVSALLHRLAPLY